MARRVSKLVDEFGTPIVLDVTPKRSSAYDAAKTYEGNKNHWRNADSVSPKSANDSGTRKILGDRSQYESDNDPYYGGMIRTHSADVFGTGPTLQCQLPENDALNARIEAKFAEHVDAIGLVQDLLICGETKVRRGEVIGIIRAMSDQDIAALKGRKVTVPLNIQWIEGEQCATPAMAAPRNVAQWVDGIELDSNGKPTVYHILREHPGDIGAYSSGFERIPADQIIHWFHAGRHGSLRGVPECAASLPLGARRRRWGDATLGAAELAASLSVIVTSDLPQGFTTEDLPAAWETMDMPSNGIMTMPAGGDAHQMKSEQPGTEYSPFKHELLKEMGRPIGSPYSITGMDGSEHNYSSLRLEREAYHAALNVERNSCRFVVLDPFFRAWYALAKLIPGYLADDISELPETVPFGWYWPGFAAIDPLKEATADTERLSNCTTTLQELLAEYGQDWRVFLTQRSRELKLMKELGLPLPKWADPGASVTGTPTETKEAGGTDSNAMARRLAIMQEAV